MARFPSADTLTRLHQVVPDQRVVRDLRDGLPDLLRIARAHTAQNATARRAQQRQRRLLAREVAPALRAAGQALDALDANLWGHERDVLAWLEGRVALFTAPPKRPGRPPTLPEGEAIAYFAAQVLAVHGHAIGSGRRGVLAQVVEVLFDELGRGPEDLVTLLRRIVPRAREYAAWARRQPGASRRTLGAVNPVPDAE